MAETKSLAELQRQIAEQERHLKALERKREKTAATLAAIDEEIAAIRGKAGAGGSRYSNAKPLHQHVRDILGKNKKGLTLAKLAEKIQAEGYKSASANFNNTVYQTLYKYNEFKRDAKTGLWSMKG